MADHPFFSIIVPVYGVEKYLRECIDSILNQTFSDFELILVDDGSKDNCPQICDEYAEKDKRIFVIHKDNGGLVDARKAGAEIARGEYCFSVDGDDYIDTSTLKDNFNIIKKYNPDIVCYGFFRKYEEKCVRHFPKIKEGYYSKEEIVKYIFPILIQSDRAEYFDYHLGYKCIRKEIYKETQTAVNPKIKIGEDSACAIPCLYKASSIYVLEKSFYYYRANNSSMTQKSVGFDINGPELIYNHLSSQINRFEYDFQEQIDRKYIHDLNTVVLSYYFCINIKNLHSTNKMIKEFLSEQLPTQKLKYIKFKSAKAVSMQLLLKYKCVFLFLCYAKLKKHF